MSVTAPEVFFKSKRNAQDIKAEVFTRFFMEWCRVYHTEGDKQTKELLLVDLFAAQGLSEDGPPVAVLQLLEWLQQNAGTEAGLTEVVRLFIGDPSNSALEKLKLVLESLAYYEQLKFPPALLSLEENQQALDQFLASSLPALVYADPFGYADARQVLLQAAAHANNDLFLLFSTQKLRSALLNDAEENFLTQLFGTSLSLVKASCLQESSAKKREQLLMEKIEEALTEKGFYPFSFKIDQPEKAPTGYYLLFASKTKQAYFRFKEFMHKYSDVEEDGVPTFSVNQKFEQPSIPGFYKTLNKYCIENLVEDLAGKRSRYHYLTVQEVFEDHSIGTSYIRSNYKLALEKLREAGLISLVDANNKQVKNITSNAILFYKLHGIRKSTKAGVK